VEIFAERSKIKDLPNSLVEDRAVVVVEPNKDNSEGGRPERKGNS